VFKERPTKKLTKRYVGLYAIEEVVLSNAVKLRLSSSMRIHPVVNVSRIVRYKEQMKRQKKEGKPVEVERVEEWEVEKNIKQEKDKGSGEVFNKVERIHSRGRYLGEERKLKKCREVD